MELEHVGTFLILLIAIFFLFRLGHALAIRYFDDSFFPWFGTLILVLLGWKGLDNNNPIGFLVFITICTYIFLKMANGLSWETSFKKRAQAVALSAGASVAVYVITHYAFGFGVTEASLGAFVAAGILGFAGYTA
jgi:hypothetical protein